MHNAKEILNSYASNNIDSKKIKKNGENHKKRWKDPCSQWTILTDIFLVIGKAKLNIGVI